MNARLKKTKERHSRPTNYSPNQKTGGFKQNVKLTDNRQESITQEKLKEKVINSSTAPFQFRGGDKYYWYRTEEHGDWIFAGKFKNHAAANSWLKANRESLGIVEFGQGGKKRYR